MWINTQEFRNDPAWFRSELDKYKALIKIFDRVKRRAMINS